MGGRSGSHGLLPFRLFVLELGDHTRANRKYRLVLRVRTPRIVFSANGVIAPIANRGHADDLAEVSALESQRAL